MTVYAITDTKKGEQRLRLLIFKLPEVVHALFKEPIIGLLKSKMAEIRHLENRHVSFRRRRRRRLC